RRPRRARAGPAPPAGAKARAARSSSAGRQRPAGTGGPAPGGVDVLAEPPRRTPGQSPPQIPLSDLPSAGLQPNAREPGTDGRSKGRTIAPSAGGGPSAPGRAPAPPQGAGPWQPAVTSGLWKAGGQIPPPAPLGQGNKFNPPPGETAPVPCSAEVRR